MHRTLDERIDEALQLPNRLKQMGKDILYSDEQMIRLILDMQQRIKELEAIKEN